MFRDNTENARLIYSIFSKITKNALKSFQCVNVKHIFLLCHLKQHGVVIGNFKQVFIVCFFMEINFH